MPQLLEFKLFVVLVFILLPRALSSGSGESSPQPEEVYKWSSLTFDWPDAETEAKYLAKGMYVPENNALAGIKVYKEAIYVTVPRWRHGVPSTLNVLVPDGEGHALLHPFPSWDMQELGNCNALQYVQSMEVDTKCGLMYIVDVGRVNILEATPVNQCPPKIVIYDLVHGEIVRMHVFPDAVASHVASFLNDVVVDRKSRFAYISDAAGVNNSGGIVAYGFDSDTSRRFSGPSTRPEVEAENMTINNVAYHIVTSSDGIALKDDASVLYFCALSGLRVYEIGTDVLRSAVGDFNFDVEVNPLVGAKISQSDGLVFSSNKKLYFGALTLNSIYSWDEAANKHTFPLSSQHLLAHNDSTMVWVDTFAFDGKGYLWFVANKLNRYLAKTMDFDEPNFRVMKVYVDDDSYLTGTAVSGAMCLNRGFYSRNYSVEYQWKTLDYRWPSDWTRKQRIAEGTYIPENSIPVDLGFFVNDTTEFTFISVPRWKPGVPSTLNRVVSANNGGYVLEPYPSWEMQGLGNCSQFQSVESIEVSSCGLMWLVDSGKVGYKDASSGDWLDWRRCLPKLVAVNLVNTTLDHFHVFSNLSDGNRLTDLVIDRFNRFAYIANSGTNGDGNRDGGIVAYDFANNRTRQYSVGAGLGPVSSLALSPDTTILYWTSDESTKLYSIRTQSLRDFMVSNQDIAAEQVRVGDKTFSSAGMTAGMSGRLYYGAQTLSSVYSWRKHEKQTFDQTTQLLLLRNNSALEWPGKLTFDSKGNLCVIANKRKQFLDGSMNWGTYNFFVWKIHTGDSSYLDSDYVKLGHCPGLRNQEKTSSDEKAVVIFTVTVTCILVVGLAVFIALLIGGRKTIMGKKNVDTASSLTSPLVSGAAEVLS